MKKMGWNKKLQLNKETVSKLNSYEMKKIAGGGISMAETEIEDEGTESPTLMSCNPTCPTFTKYTKRTY